MVAPARAGRAVGWPQSCGGGVPVSAAAGPSREFLYAGDSWGEAAWWNLTRGQLGKWQFFLLSGRIWQTLGLFILGMLAGRWRLFADAPGKRVLFLRLLAVSLLLFLSLLAVRTLLVPLTSSPAGSDLRHLVLQWENLSYVAAFVSGAVLLFSRHGLHLASALIGRAGKSTLPRYVTPTQKIT